MSIASNGWMSSFEPIGGARLYKSRAMEEEQSRSKQGSEGGRAMTQKTSIGGIASLIIGAGAL